MVNGQASWSGCFCPSVLSQMPESPALSPGRPSLWELLRQVSITSTSPPAAQLPQRHEPDPVLCTELANHTHPHLGRVRSCLLSVHTKPWDEQDKPELTEFIYRICVYERLSRGTRKQEGLLHVGTEKQDNKSHILIYWSLDVKYVADLTLPFSHHKTDMFPFFIGVLLFRKSETRQGAGRLPQWEWGVVLRWGCSNGYSFKQKEHKP